MKPKRKEEILESKLLQDAGLGTWAVKLNQIIFEWKRWRVVCTQFESDAKVGKYWSNTVFEKGAEVFRNSSFEEKKNLQDAKQFLFDFIKMELNDG